jgi:alpha-tubulin suppressor-like RCC1 family protein
VHTSLRVVTVSLLLAAGLVLVDAGPLRAGTTGWRSVATGYEHTCAITTAGQLFCWGSDGVGQLGDGTDLVNQPTPVAVEPNITDWRSVSAGGNHTCATRQSGRLYCWGADTWGALGDDAPLQFQPSPVEVAGGRTDWASVAAGGSHTCARRTDDVVHCWGHDDFGQVGDGAGATDRPTPVRITGRWTSVTAGLWTTCGRARSGRLFCWGRDLEGQLGNGRPAQSRAQPSEVAGDRTDWAPKATAAAGGVHACARRDGRLHCWGTNVSGPLGIGPGDGVRHQPTAVATLATDWTSVGAGQAHTCARRAVGRVLCWGLDHEGQLGDDATTTTRRLPVVVAGGHQDWLGVSVGWEHTCGRRDGGTLWCWGSDDSGQLGDDAPLSDAPTPRPVPVP